MTNEELNKLDIWKDRKCIKCHRKYPKTILNIEGVIHHNGKMICVDSGKCEKIAKTIEKHRKLKGE